MFTPQQAKVEMQLFGLRWVGSVDMLDTVADQ